MLNRVCSALVPVLCKLQQYLLQGSRVWFPHEDLVWVGGELTKDLKKDGVLEIELETGEVCAVLTTVPLVVLGRPKLDGSCLFKFLFFHR